MEITPLKSHSFFVYLHSRVVATNKKFLQIPAMIKTTTF